MEIIINEVKFKNVPDKRYGTKINDILTQSNIGISTDVSEYMQSDDFYAIVNSLDIDWDGIEIDDNTTINTTSDLINWLKSISSSSIVVDNQLSNTSINPVQNKVINRALEDKINKVAGKGLSTNDYTNEDKEKVAAALTEHQDISGKADKTALQTEVTRATTVEENLRQLYNNLQQSQPVPVTSLPATGEVGKIYRLAGTTSYSDYMWNGTQFIKMAEYDNAIDNEPVAGSDNLVKSGSVYNFAFDLAKITNGIPILDTINNTFTLQAGTYICGKSEIQSLQEDLVWSRSDTYIKAFGYLILDFSTMEHRVVASDVTPYCSDNECIIALVDWWHGVIRGNFYSYYLNGKLVSKDGGKANYKLQRPVFWREGHLEIVKNRTSSAKISVRVLEDCLFFLTDRWVIITASDSYVDCAVEDTALLGIMKDGDTYVLSLQRYSAYPNLDNFYVLTSIFYNYIGDANRDLDKAGLISNIDSTINTFITFQNLRCKKVAKDWAYKVNEDNYNIDIFSKQFFYDREKLLTLTFSVKDPSVVIRARSAMLHLTVGGKYFIVQNSYTNQYQYQILNSSGIVIVGGYTNSVREFTVPNDDGIVQIMLKKSDDSEFTVSDIETLNSNDVYDLYSSKQIATENSILKRDVITNLWGSAEFLDGYFYSINPGVNPITYGGKQANATMTCCEVKVRPGTKLYTFAPYMMIAYLDENKNFINGYYYNYETTQPTLIQRVTEVPWNAAYAQISTRLSHKYETVVTECQFPSAGLESYRSVSKHLVPQSQILHQELNRIYDREDFVSDAWNNNLAFSGTVTVNSDKNLVMSSNSMAKVTGLHTTLDKSTIGANVRVTTVPSSGKIIRFGYFGSGVVGTGISDADTWIDVYNNKVELYNGNISGNVSTLKSTSTLSESIAANDEIELKIIKDSIYRHTIKVMKRYAVIGEIELTATVDPDDSDHALNQMRSWGAPAIWAGSDAAIIVSRLFFYSDCPQYAKLAIVGDSYVENMSRSKAAGWVRLLEEKMGKDNIFISGQGGGSATSLITKLPVELNLCRPKYVILHTGTNDAGTGTESQITNYKNRMLQLIDMVKAVNAIPILMTTPRVVNSGSDDQGFVTAINPWVKSLGYKYVDIAYCLSTGDGVTMDTNRMRPDKVHPNHVGAQAILNWVENNLPEIL